MSSAYALAGGGPAHGKGCTGGLLRAVEKRPPISSFASGLSYSATFAAALS